MPPRFAYWTIIAGGHPTAFRSATPEELLPTLRQLQSKHPDAVMKWFSRGQLWESPAEATTALRAQRTARDTRRSGPDRRGPDWRPGGQHQDPRDRFKVPRDVKRKRFAERVRRSAGPLVRGSQDQARPSRPERRTQGPRDQRTRGPKKPR
jgi:hypothetical protein